MIRGWVYIIINKSMPDLLKIGFTLKDPVLRAKELDNTGVPYKYQVVYDVLVEEPQRCENILHKDLVEYKEEKEWFRIDISKAVTFIRSKFINQILLEKNYLGDQLGDPLLSETIKTNFLCEWHGCTAEAIGNKKGKLCCSTHYFKG